MAMDEIKKTLDMKMDQSIAAFKHNLTKIRTGRANPALLDTVHVDYYGAMVPISQVANLSLLDSRTISVQPWEKGMGAKIEKAIRDSDLGVSPSNDGVVIRINLPALTEERRKEYVKIIKHMAEDGRIAVRAIRRDARKQLDTTQKAGEISEDDVERAEKELDKITHDHVDLIDKAMGRKEHELLEV